MNKNHRHVPSTPVAGADDLHEEGDHIWEDNKDCQHELRVGFWVRRGLFAKERPVIPFGKAG